MSIRKHKPSLFVTFEGIDGCGKTTQLDLSAKYLSKLGYQTIRLREPGSTPVAEKVRKILLDRRLSISDVTELLLYEAARAEITRQEIVPFLKSGKIVLCDRFYDSTTAYQGYGRGLDLKMIRQLHRLATGGCLPDLTLVFNLTLNEARRRLGDKRDRLEGQPRAFHERVRRGFLEIARKEPRRVKVIEASRPAEHVFEEVSRYLDGKLDR